MDTPVLSPLSSQESNKYAGPAVFNYQLDPEDDITQLLEQLYDLARVSWIFLKYICNTTRGAAAAADAAAIYINIYIYQTVMCPSPTCFATST